MQQLTPPISCAAFEHGLGDYVEHELAYEQMRCIEAHAEGCQGCRRLLDEYRAIAPIVRKATDASMPLEARARLRRLVEHASRHRC